MQLTSWWGWNFVAEVPGPTGVSYSHQLNLPNGTYSAFCALTAATVNNGTLSPFNGIVCGILTYTANGKLVAPQGPSYGFPFLFPTNGITQITFQLTALATSNGEGYVYVSGWQ